MKNLKQIYSSIKFKLIGALIKKYGSIRFTPCITRDSEGECEAFEKDVLQLLKKYKVINSTRAIQKVNISLDANDYPEIKIMKYIMENYDEE